MSEDKMIDEQTSSDEMIQRDLGKPLDSIYRFLETVQIATEERLHYAPSYYQERLTEVRNFLLALQQEFARVLRARTKAQTRLTSRESRLELILADKLNDDPYVKAGLSIEDRKARASSLMLDIKNAVRESKNEVESLKNLEKVLTLFNKNLGTVSADLKKQASLLLAEMPNRTIVPAPVGAPEVAKDVGSAFQESMNELLAKYEAEPVAAEEESEESLNLEDEAVQEAEEENLLEEQEVESEAESLVGIQEDVVEQIPETSEEPLDTLPLEDSSSSSDEGSIGEISFDDEDSSENEEILSISFDVEDDSAQESTTPAEPVVEETLAPKDPQGDSLGEGLDLTESSEDDDFIVFGEDDVLSSFEPSSDDLQIQMEKEVPLSLGQDGLLSGAGEVLDEEGPKEDFPVELPENLDLAQDDFTLLSATETPPKLSPSLEGGREVLLEAEVSVKKVTPEKEPEPVASEEDVMAELFKELGLT